MPMHYQFPPPEGPLPRGPSEWIIYEHDEVPIKIGSLEREVFNYIGNWNVLIGQSGYGYAWRMATKEVTYHNERFDLFLHFTLPLIKRGLPYDRGKLIEAHRELESLIDSVSIGTQQKYNETVIYTLARPAEWMVGELMLQIG